MDLIIDANILFAALIRDSITAKLIFMDKLNLYSPEFLLDEVKKHKIYLLNKTHRTENEFNFILSLIASRIDFIPIENIKPYLKKADKISPDPDDSIYFAAALNMVIPIWSNEKRLKDQKVIKIYTTSDLYKKFRSDIE